MRHMKALADRGRKRWQGATVGKLLSFLSSTWDNISEYGSSAISSCLAVAPFGVTYPYSHCWLLPFDYGSLGIPHTINPWELYSHLGTLFAYEPVW